MEVFLANTVVIASVPMVDGNGNQIVASAISYRVIDQDDFELVPLTALAGFAAGSSNAVITVASSANQLAAGLVRGARTIQLTCTTASNTVVISHSYALELVEPLTVGVNSFQSFSYAKLTAMDVPDIPGWDAATDRQKISALVDARNHICKLNFRFLGDSWSSSYGGNLSSLTPSQYGTLPASLRNALRLAQIAEADFILGGDPVMDKIQSGVILDSIGESKQMYASRPLQMVVCRRALNYLSGHITLNLSIGRA